MLKDFDPILPQLLLMKNQFNLHLYIFNYNSNSLIVLTINISFLILFTYISTKQ